jgi:CheY-like chemotaxis protein
MPCRNLRFLVVEDHPTQRLALVALLRNLGAQDIHEAGDGRAALEIIRDPLRPVDIVISDISMPEMDGMELVRNLAAAASPVGLVLSSGLRADLLASIANMALAYRVNLLGVVGKPVSAAKLVPLVQLYRGSQKERAATPRRCLPRKCFHGCATAGAACRRSEPSAGRSTWRSR